MATLPQIMHRSLKGKKRPILKNVAKVQTIIKVIVNEQVIAKYGMPKIAIMGMNVKINSVIIVFLILTFNKKNTIIAKKITLTNAISP